MLFYKKMWFVGHCSNEGRLFVVTIVKNYLWNQSRSVGMWRAQFLDPKSFKREKSFDQRWRSNFVDETSQKLRRSGKQKLRKSFFDKNFATTRLVLVCAINKMVKFKLLKLGWYDWTKVHDIDSGKDLMSLWLPPSQYIIEIISFWQLEIYWFILSIYFQYF